MPAFSIVASVCLLQQVGKDKAGNMVTSEKSQVVDLGGLDQDGRRRAGECGVLQTKGGKSRREY